MANGGFVQGIQDAPRRRDADLTERWRKTDDRSVSRAESVVADPRVAGNADLAMPTVALREIGAVVERWRPSSRSAGPSA